MAKKRKSRQKIVRGKRSCKQSLFKYQESV